MLRVDELTRDYVAALQRYLEHPGEASLAAAYEIGRATLERGAGILEMEAAHRDALEEILRGSRSGEEAAATTRASIAFLLEALGPFEMAFRGFREANESLQAMNERLEELVIERTSELREAIDGLRRVDEQRRRLLRRLTEAQEEERRVIANAFHDDAIQLMTAISMRLATLKKRFGDAEPAEQLQRLDESLREGIARARHLLFELRPPSLDRQGLQAAVRELLDRFSAEVDVPCRFEHALAEEPSQETRALAFRVLEEALRNVRKHARAHSVHVELRSEDGGVLLRVIDDGKGFPPSAIPDSPPGHLGLTAMRERAELAGGWFRVTSAPGKGTTLEAWFPLYESTEDRGA